MARLDILKQYLRLLASEADSSTRARLAASLAIAVAGSFLAGLAPLALKSLVDTLALAHATQAPAHGDRALLLGGAYLLALYTGRVLSDLRPLLAERAEQRLQARMGRRYFSHLLELPLQFHAESQTGALTSGLSQANAACRLVLNSLMQCTTIVVELVTVLAVLGHLGQPALAVVFASSAVAYALVFATSAAGVRTLSRAVSEATLQLQATLTDSLLNIEAIKCLNAASAMRMRFEAAASTLDGCWSGLHRQRGRMGLAVAAVFAASVGSSLVVAGSAVASGSLTIGGFVLVTVYMLQMVRPLELLGGTVRDTMQAIEFARPLLEVLDMRAEGTAGAGSPAAKVDALHGSTQDPATKHGSPRISFRDVHLAYQDDRPVLQSFSLDVPAGATVAIVGASGAGKSSIARLLLRLIDVRSGRISWDGMPVDQFPLEALRDRIGFVPQDTTLFNDTIAANIAMGRPGASRQQIDEASRRAQLRGLAESSPAGLDAQVGERGLKLSGGERQRIAIARAILRRPQLYLFDEVSSMLDGPTEAALLQDLREICAGCTTIFITHRLAAARRADFIVVLEDGKVSERGSHAELLAMGGSYSKMWDAQAGLQASRGAEHATTTATANGATSPSRPFARRRAGHRRHA